MYNEITKEKNPNVSVYLRLRPPQEDQTFIDQLGKDRKTIQVQKDFEIRNFRFDKIFLPREPQFTVFINSCSSVLKGVVRGFNGCLFAYGQTGSGKTFTILGEPSLNIQGILQYSIAYLLSLKKEITLELSCIQVYMENLYDLFSEKETKININYTNSKGAVPKNLIKYKIENMKELEQIIQVIFNNRKTKKTYMNKRSSRSHAIFRIAIHNPEYENCNYLNIVDLAGSERIKKSKIIKNVQRNETISINTSLMALGKCIKHLSQNFLDQSFNFSQSISENSIDNFSQNRSSKSINRNMHVPYRDSKLTMILQNSLSGKSLLALIVTISPDIHNVGESFSSLRFASSVMKLEIQPQRNEISTPKKKKSPDFPKQQEQDQQEQLPKFASKKQNNNIDYNTNFTFQDQNNNYLSTKGKEQSTQIISDYSQSDRLIYQKGNQNNFQVEELFSQNHILKKQNESLIQQLEDSKFLANEQKAHFVETFNIPKNEALKIPQYLKNYLQKGKKCNQYEEFLTENFSDVKDLFFKQKQQIQNLQQRANILENIQKLQIPSKRPLSFNEKIRQYFKVKKIYNFLINKSKNKNQINHFKKIKIAMGKEMLAKLMKNTESMFKKIELNLNPLQLIFQNQQFFQ